MKLGILGGSFNPVHLGHLFLADKALSALELDRVIFIPAYRSPFKLAAADMEDTANDRLQMLSAAVAGDSRFAVDDCELRRGGISYTIDTLVNIIERYLPEGKPYLIIGDDLAAEFPQWKDSEKILQKAEIVIARRLGSAAADYPYPHLQIENEVMNISSQMVRERIGGGSGWRPLVPAGVRALIEDRRLYGYKAEMPVNSAVSRTEDCTQANILRVETAARESLTPERFLHSRNTALLAADMCRRFGFDPAAGYLAGIAHDLAKQLDGKQLLKIAKSDGLKISGLEKDRPNLLHGKAAAVLLRERFCIHNKEVLEAVAYHTSGCEDMGQLAKIIYIADKTEASRNIDPALRELCRNGELDVILSAVLDRTVAKLRSKGLKLSADTTGLLKKMKGKNS